MNYSLFCLAVETIQTFVNELHFHYTLFSAFLCVYHESHSECDLSILLVTLICDQGIGFFVLVKLHPIS